ncbi:hypothetical protein G6L47_03275 [Agrobacterium rubi]|nr:hypothetical protein [Agrobacterium rubi]
MTTQHPDTSAAPDDLTARALAGPHRFWDTYDMTLEGARFHRLHEIVSATDPNLEDAKEVIAQILSFASGYGYGQADSFLFEFGGLSGDEMEEDDVAAIRRDDLMYNYDETMYFEYVSKSNRLVADAAATKEARDIVSNLTVNALNAYCAGRDSRMDAAEPTDPAPSP